MRRTGSAASVERKEAVSRRKRSLGEDWGGWAKRKGKRGKMKYRKELQLKSLLGKKEKEEGRGQIKSKNM